MDVASVLFEQAGKHPGGIIGVPAGVHCVGRLGEGVPPVINLKKPAPVAAVAHDVAAGIAVRATGLLRCYGREELGVEAVALGRPGDRRRKRHAAEASRETIGSRFMVRLNPPKWRFDKERCGF